MLTRAAIVDAVLAAVDAVGVDRLALRDVTDRLGVTPPALYDHFDGKDALLRAAAERTFQELAARLGRHAGTPLERVEADVRAYVAYAREHPRRYPLMLRYPPPAMTVPGLDGDLAAAAEAYERGAANVRAAAGADDLVPLVTWALAHGVATLVSSTRLDGADADRLLDAAVALLRGGLGAGAAAGREAPTSAQPSPR